MSDKVDKSKVKEITKTKPKSKFVRVTREEALKNRVHTYPYLIV